MKRSEMVDKMTIIYSVVSMREEHTPQERMSLLLEAMENIGILPPEYYRPKNYGTGYELTYSQWIQLPSKIREWEKENL